LATSRKADPREARASIGRRIRQLRKDCGLTQLELAQKANVHLNHIQGVETAAKRATIEMYCAIARALDVDWTDLLKRPVKGRSGRKA